MKKLLGFAPLLLVLALIATVALTAAFVSATQNGADKAMMATASSTANQGQQQAVASAQTVPILTTDVLAQRAAPAQVVAQPQAEVTVEVASATTCDMGQYVTASAMASMAGYADVLPAQYAEGSMVMAAELPQSTHDGLGELHAPPGAVAVAEIVGTYTGTPQVYLT